MAFQLAQPPRGPGSHPLRVLYVVSLFPCWSETFIVSEIEELLRLGVDVRILSLRAASEPLVQPEAAALAARVLYAPAASASLRHRRQTLQLMSAVARGLARHPHALVKSVVTLSRTAAASRTVEALAPHIIHAHWATYPSTAALLLSRSLGIPFSFTAHAHDIFLENHLVDAKLRAAAFAVTISEFNRQLLERWSRGTATKCQPSCAVLYPLERFPFQPEDREPGLILAVGRLDPIKGFRVLVEACQLLRTAGVRFRCDIVGDGPQREELAAQIVRDGLEEQVRLRGALAGQEVRRLLYRALVFALPSVVTPQGNMDGIPVALMEAMASGVPVVSTTVSGIPELVRDGLSGHLVAPGDSHAVSRTLQLLLEDGPLRMRFATAARRVVEKQFDVSTETGKLHVLLREAAGVRSEFREHAEHDA